MMSYISDKILSYIWMKTVMRDDQKNMIVTIKREARPKKLTVEMRRNLLSRFLNAQPSYVLGRDLAAQRMLDHNNSCEERIVHTSDLMQPFHPLLILMVPSMTGCAFLYNEYCLSTSLQESAFFWMRLFWMNPVLSCSQYFRERQMEINFVLMVLANMLFGEGVGLKTLFIVGLSLTCANFINPCVKKLIDCYCKSQLAAHYARELFATLAFIVVSAAVFGYAVYTYSHNSTDLLNNEKLCERFLKECCQAAFDVFGLPVTATRRDLFREHKEWSSRCFATGTDRETINGALAIARGCAS